MRPPLLDPLFAPVTSLPRIGPKIAQLLARVLPRRADGSEPHVASLLFLLPRRVIDRRNRATLATVTDGAEATLALHIDSHQFAPDHNKRVPHRIIATDETGGDIALTFFNAQRPWLEKAYPVGADVTVFGTVESWNYRWSMVHPEKLSGSTEDGTLALVEPVYPSVEGLSRKVMREAVRAAVDRIPVLPEWLDRSVMDAHGLPQFAQALAAVHAPTAPDDIEPASTQRKRLALDDFLAAQLALALTRRHSLRLSGSAMPGDGSLTEGIRRALPYRLTGAQARSIAEIGADMASGERMVRLLQGDVGAGKTVVALFAMAQAAEAGFQSALMAPTELLARQHFAGLSRISERTGLRLALLTGRMKPAERRQVAADLASGAVHGVIGTHALFQEDVIFARLGLVVVDEQHRFGVHQRLALASKGAAADLLVMTATPIPRTLVLAAYGDMDSSRLDEKPVGRKPIQTVAMPLERLDELASRLETAMRDGARVYWVCPLVEDSEALEGVMSVDNRFGWARKRFGNAAVLIHGRMDTAEKDAAMAAFRDGPKRLLIATTVIEVGVDVPDATIIVIENAERFGLAQLHQLRGRVGRGAKPSSCVLLYSGPLGETARARLDILRQTEDGFRIAEEDLRLRGEGDLLGTRQSGEAQFRLADLSAHRDMLDIARDDARLILARDPDLSSERGQALRLLLHLFGKDEAVRLLKAG
ncbi:MAG: ATP-dependent DNA helicase RecG [Rhizobiaceae bacterium]|jgi:ATP-dependent DNA helicase RecG|nr:ATP-dependent DNA helicase RecG [Rhizobiaceae bacterium]